MRVHRVGRILKRTAAILAIVVVALLGLRIYDSERGAPLEPWHTYIPTELSVAELDRGDWRACEEYDSGRNAGAAANMAKYLAAKASWEAANACLQTHGGFGFANEYDAHRR